MNFRPHLKLRESNKKPALMSTAHHYTKYMDHYRFNPTQERTTQTKHKHNTRQQKLSTNTLP